MSRRAAVVLGLTLALVSCKTPTLQGTIDDLGERLNELLGGETLPAKHVQVIYDVHQDDRSWRFRPDEANALERTTVAVQGLADAAYGSWREAAIVVALLTTMAEDHPSALVRAASLDSLTRIGVWTAAAVAPSDRKATEDEAAAAVQRIFQVAKTKDPDPAAAADVADALNTVAAYRLDRSGPLPEKVDLRVLARGSRSQLATARGLLRALTGSAVGHFDADPRVRDALDRALVSTSASAIRLALVAAASGAPEAVVRTAAVRDLEQARPEQGAAILSSIVLGDDQSSVRREAARALRSFPEKEAVPALIEALSDERLEVRASAASSLAAVTGQSFGDDRRAWAKWWQGRTGAPSEPGPGTGTK